MSDRTTTLEDDLATVRELVPFEGMRRGRIGDALARIEAALADRANPAEPTLTEETIASRWVAGDSFGELALDYGMREDLVQRAIRKALRRLFALAADLPHLEEGARLLEAGCEEGWFLDDCEKLMAWRVVERTRKTNR